MKYDNIRIANRAGPSRTLWIVHGGSQIWVQDTKGPESCVVDVMVERFGRFVGVVLRDEVPTGATIDLVVCKPDDEGDLKVDSSGFCDLGLVAIPNDSWPGEAHSLYDPDSQPALAAATDARSDIKRPILRLEWESIRRGSPDDASRRAAWFMWYYDNHTSGRWLVERQGVLERPYPVEESESNFRRAAVQSTMSLAAARLKCRMDLAAAGERDPHRIRAAVAAVGGAKRVDPFATAHLAAVQAAIVDGFYGGGLNRPCREAALADAMERFASGTMALTKAKWPEIEEPGVSQAAPDGPVIFMFAEFALMALEQKVGVDHEAWLRLARIYVGMQTLYRHAYGNPQRPATAAEFVNRSGGPLRPVPVDIRRMWFPAVRHATEDDLIVLMGDHLVECVIAGIGPLASGVRSVFARTG